MKNIDTTRLLNLLRWDLATYKKSYRNMFLVPCGAILIVALLSSSYLFSWGSDWHPSMFLSAEMTIPAIMIVMMAMVAVMGRAFDHLHSTQDRIGYFMLPASNLEKYIVRVLFRGIIMFAELIIAIIAADVIFGLLCLLRTGEFYNCISMTQFFDSILGTGSATFVEWTEAALAVLLIWSFFLVGSAFFRRNAILMTFLVWTGATLLLSAVAAFCLGFGVAWFNDVHEGSTITIDWIVAPDIVINGGFIIGMLAWLVFDIWWAYRLFTRMQVINNRWNNLKK